MVQLRDGSTMNHKEMAIPAHFFNASRSTCEFLLFLCELRTAFAAAVVNIGQRKVLQSVVVENKRSKSNNCRSISETVQSLEFNNATPCQVKDDSLLKRPKHDPADNSVEESETLDLSPVFHTTDNEANVFWFNLAEAETPLAVLIIKTAMASGEASPDEISDDIAWISIHAAEVSSVLTGFLFPAPKPEAEMEIWCKNPSQISLSGRASPPAKFQKMKSIENQSIDEELISESSKKIDPRDISYANEQQKLVLESVTKLFEEQLLRRGFSEETDEFWQEKGAFEFQRQLFFYVRRNNPILFVLPAFPFKNINKRTFVFGDLPDMAEKVAISRLEKFIKDIGQFYAPGGQLVLFSDGHVYNDLLGIPDSQVNEYKAALMKMRSYQSESESKQFIYVSDFREFYPHIDYAPMRRRICNVFGASEESLRQKLKSDANTALLFVGFNRHFRKLNMFRYGEAADDYQNNSNETAEKASAYEHSNCNEPKIGARERRKRISKLSMAFLQRNSAYKGFIQCAFPDHVRLSIHPSTNGQKFGVAMVSSDDWSPPWNACAVLRSSDNSWRLVKRAEAEKNQYIKRVSPDGLPYYVQPVPNEE